MQWVTKEKFLDLSGLSSGVLRGWFDRHLHRGIHYQVIGHTTLVHLERIEEWISQRDYTDTASQGSELKYSDMGNQSTAKHSAAISALDTSRQL